MTHISLHRPTGFWQQFASGARKQASVIAALVIKDFKSRSSKVRLGMLWMILDPMVMMVMFAVLHYMIGRTSIEGVSIFLFLSSGFITYAIVKQGIGSVPRAIKMNSSLLNFPQVRPISCIAARFLFEMCLLLITAVILYFILWWFWDLVPSFHDPLRLIQAVAIALTLSFGLSLLLGVYVTLYDTVGKLASLVARPLLFLSCVIHSLRDVPASGRYYILLNPITHLVDTARTSMFNIVPLPEVNLYYPTMWAVSLLGVGILAYYVNRYRLIQE